MRPSKRRTEQSVRSNVGQTLPWTAGSELVALSYTKLRVVRVWGTIRSQSRAGPDDHYRARRQHTHAPLLGCSCVGCSSAAGKEHESWTRRMRHRRIRGGSGRLQQPPRPARSGHGRVGHSQECVSGGIALQMASGGWAALLERCRVTPPSIFRGTPVARYVCFRDTPVASLGMRPGSVPRHPARPGKGAKLRPSPLWRDSSYRNAQPPSIP